MNRPPAWSSREESLLLLNAYLDNELDAASVLDVERRIASDAALKAEYDRLFELRSALASHLTKEHASQSLRDRVAAIADARPPITLARTQRPVRSFDWRQLAAAAIVAACLGSVGTYLTLSQSTSSSEIAAILTGHQRALLATQPFDVASSDRHTVKPWFDTKLALSPQVIDLASDGFPLTGGRVDLVEGRGVPVIVYRRRAHIISVIAIPHPGEKDVGAPPTRSSQDGYSVLRWAGRDFDYAAVSDLAENELEEFVTRWRSDAATN